MFRFRSLIVGCALASVSACSEPITGPGGASGLNSITQDQLLVGIVEAMDQGYGLRIASSLIPLVYSDLDALANAVGLEVSVHGQFIGGVFIVESLSMGGGGEDPEPEYMRLPMAKKQGGSSSGGKQ